MSTYGYQYGKKRRRLNYKAIFALLAVIGGILSITLLLKMYFTDKKMEEYTINIQELKQEEEALKESIPALEKTIEELQKEAGELEDIIEYVKPVVVPESMKK